MTSLEKQQEYKEFEILPARSWNRGDQQERQPNESLEHIRKSLLRLLASSKRAAYTRHILNTKFAAERRQLLKQSKNCTFTSSFVLPAHDNGKTREQQEELAYIKLEQKETRWIDELEKDSIMEKEHVIDGNAGHGYYENDKRSSKKSARYYYRRLSLTMIEDEEASPVQKSKFEW